MSKGGVLTIEDATEGLGEGVIKAGGKAAVVNYGWIITVIVNEKVRSRRLDDPDKYEFTPRFRGLKAYFVDKLGQAFDDEDFLDRIMRDKSTIDPDACVWSKEASLEVNQKGRLHAHLILRAECPREVDPRDPKGRLRRPLLDTKALNDAWRDVFGREVSCAVRVRAFHDNAQNVESYTKKYL